MESDSQNIRKRNKNILHLTFILLLKMHSFWLLLFVISGIPRLIYLIKVKKNHEKDIYALVRSIEKIKTKYAKTILDITFLKQCKEEQLIPTFANARLSTKGSNIKLKHRISRIIIEDGSQ